MVVCALIFGKFNISMDEENGEEKQKTNVFHPAKWDHLLKSPWGTVQYVVEDEWVAPTGPREVVTVTDLKKKAWITVTEIYETKQKLLA